MAKDTVKALTSLLMAALMLAAMSITKEKEQASGQLLTAKNMKASIKTVRRLASTSAHSRMALRSVSSTLRASRSD